MVKIWHLPSVQDLGGKTPKHIYLEARFSNPIDVYFFELN